MQLNSHYITLEQYRKTASLSRSSLFLETSDSVGRLTNIYKIRYQDHGDWISSNHPDDNALEWLYFDGRGVPAFYWSLESKGLVLI